MVIDTEKLGWPYNRLKSPDHLGWLYRNADKPLPPINQRRQALFSFTFLALIQLGGYRHCGFGERAHPGGSWEP